MQTCLARLWLSLQQQASWVCLLVAIVIAVRRRPEIPAVLVYGRPLQLSLGGALHIPVKFAGLQ